MKEINIKYRSYVLGELAEDELELVRAAENACATSYSPYSGFKVGAAVRFDDGSIMSSSNQESEVFPSGMCAERGLLYYVQAHSEGRRIAAMAITSRPGERECYPCGACRQVIADVCKRQGVPFRLLMCSEATVSVVDDARVLLPFLFEL